MGNHSPLQQEDRLLRLGEVLARFPVSRSAWYQGIKDGIYPQQVKLGPRSSAWRASDINVLISSIATKEVK
jgi:prophage regulatory protein